MTTISSFKGDNAFLSNFYPVTVILDDVWYPSVEHAYQAAKTTDLEARKTSKPARPRSPQGLRVWNRCRV